MDDNGRRTLLSLPAFFLIVHAALALTLAVTDEESSLMSNLLEGLSSPPNGWSRSTSHCKWTGVSCDPSDHVTSISLNTMSLSGTLPPDFSPLSRLKYITLQHNALSGPIPSFANLGNLEEIFLDNNNFTEVPPGVFQGLTSLQELSLTNNPNLKPWTLPEELKDSSLLTNLFASGANVAGSLPDIFHKHSSLQNVRLSYNNLTGPLPASFKGSNIQTIWLNNQEQGLSGTLDVLSGMAQLTQAWFHVNQFTGPIPDLSKCQSLFDLQLRDNHLTGIVPASLISLPSIQNVSLDSNKLQGPIPENPGNIKLTFHDDTFCKTTPGPCDPQVTTLLEVAGALGYPMEFADSWAGNDACNGWSFVACQAGKVTVVNLAKQHFVGTISASLAELTSLRSIILNDNNLTGSIPKSLTELPDLQLLDLSNNNLSGLIPTFRPEVKVITSGNPLIGKNLSSGGGGGGGGGSMSRGAIAAIIIVLLIFVGVGAFISYRYCCQNNCKNPWKLDSSKHRPAASSKHLPKSPQQRINPGILSDFPIFDNGSVMVSIEVLRQVTKNFFPGNIIGRGGFGTVYRGEFEDGLEIAVKRMESSALSDKGNHEFQAEISVLTQVRHRHLVALLGYCIHGNERLLVYEYMPRGTLSQHLFEWQQKGIPPLSWNQRLTVAVDVARGVEYLHSLAQQSFIHRDLKPSNILLGEDMRAKVSDFGLVRNAPDGKYSVETRLAGTFGYLAPEYAATGKVTTKVDVFAFGIILMELITGRKALDDSVSDERSHLVSWFRRLLINKEDLKQGIDETLELGDQETLNSINKVAELSGHCTNKEPQQRPDMGHVVNVLSPLIEQWRPDSQYGMEEEVFGSSDVSLNLSLPQILQRWQSEGTSTMYGNSTTMYGNTNTSSYGLSQNDSSTGVSSSGYGDSSHFRRG